MIDPLLPDTSARLEPLGDRTWVAPSAAGTVDLAFPFGPLFLLADDHGRRVLPGTRTYHRLSGSGRCWVLPEQAESDRPAWSVESEGVITTVLIDGRWHVTADAAGLRLTRHRARPHADVDGAAYRFDIPDGDRLADALAGFSWGTMLPSVIERTVAASYADADGYVISSLADTYLGTYPDVDHEFQIKGRLAMGSRTELAVVGRMIDLQLRMMREDPTGLWRDPCAVQPDGTREYHVRRASLDGTRNAVMFLVTGNVEILESAWLYVGRTSDLDWLADRIVDLEGAASGVELHVDPRGRLWGDVYYEDQVIKDGRETMAQALAVRSFRLLADLESLLERDERTEHYRGLADRMAASLREPLPQGWWDPEHARFVDWVDRDGVAHDHLHLLANVLPGLVGAATAEQSEAVDALVCRELDEFQRFPTFLSARLADYTDDEIGDGGPYDLCAAGRYWCWDAAYWASRGDSRRLHDQLVTVAAQGAADGWVMGERYDMDHVYYVDGSPWHGAAHYYEYPCVFTWVLIHDHLGLSHAPDVDLVVAPRLSGPGAVTLEQDAYRVSYDWDGRRLRVQNLADRPRTLRIDLRALVGTAQQEPTTVVVGAGGIVRIDGLGGSGEQ